MRSVNNETWLQVGNEEQKMQNSKKMFFFKKN